MATSPTTPQQQVQDCTLWDGKSLAFWINAQQPVVARRFAGRWWVVTIAQQDPETFFVRGRNFLLNSAQVIAGPSGFGPVPACYYGLFDTPDSDYSGFAPAAGFVTPPGYTLVPAQDGTPMYRRNAANGVPLTPTVAVEAGVARNAAGQYEVLSGTSVTLSTQTCTGIRTAWYQRNKATGGATKIADDAFLIRPIITGDETQFFARCVDAYGVESADSNIVEFKMSLSGTVTATPTRVKNSVYADESPAWNIECAAIADYSVRMKRGTVYQQVNGTYQIIGGRFIFTFAPNGRPQVGDKLDLSVTCQGKTASPASTEIDVIALPADPCAGLTDGMAIGTKNGSVLQLRKLPNDFYVAQIKSTNPDAYFPRGVNFLNGAALTTSVARNCIAGGDTGYDGLAKPAGATPPAGYVAKTEPDGAVYFEAFSGAAPVPPAAPAIATGLTGQAGATVEGTTAATGTLTVFRNGQQIASFAVTPAQGNLGGTWSYRADLAGTYTFKLTNAAGTSAASAEVVIAVNTSSPCQIADGQKVGQLGPHDLVARLFNNALWLTQRLQATPEHFVVRGRNLLALGSVQTTFAACQNSFAGGNTGYDGFVPPPSFLAPAGYTLVPLEDGTPSYRATAEAADPCAIADGQQVGTLNGARLIARRFAGQLWLTQQLSTAPDQFIVRGRNLLLKGDVTSNYKACAGAFAGGDTGYDGFARPEGFQTPVGFTVENLADGTPSYVAAAGSGLSANYTLDFDDECGNALEYAVSRTIADAASPALVWQDSPEFNLTAGVWYGHAREKANHAVRKTGQFTAT